MLSRFIAKPPIIALLLVLFGVALNCWYLDSYPKVWVDEPWISIPSYHLITDGVLRNEVLSAREYRGRVMLAPVIFQNLAIAPVFAFAGVGAWQARLPSAIMGIIIILMTFFLMRRYGDVIAVGSAVLVSIDSYIFISSRTARPEIFVTAFALGSFLLLHSQNNSDHHKSKIVLAGILSGVGLWIHPNYFLVAISLLLINLILSKPKQKITNLLWLICGMAMGVMPYILYVLHWDYNNGFLIFKTQLMDRTNMIVKPIDFILSTWGREIDRYMRYINFPNRFPLFLIQVAAGISAMKRKDRFDKTIMVIIAVHIALFPILISNRTPRYLTVLMPFITILVVKMIRDIIHRQKSPEPRSTSKLAKKNRTATIGAVALAIVYFANQAGGNAFSIWRTKGCGYSNFIKQVREIVPPHSKVWGTMTFWYGFYDYSFRTQYTDDLMSFRPDCVLLYDNDIWRKQTGVSGRENDKSARWQPLRKQLTDLIEKRGTYLGAVSSSCYGNIKIYRLNWTE